ncbi:putative uncharacterized protein DDB_G0282133 isoform X2 [Ostrinia nubilalis]|uniref:putative uncharacterized protein DDB_G0282133 isoform X2 n=1 Tax=Ostrinia nubilalis TaxID=29057 RepID=UPI0030825EE5
MDLAETMKSVLAKSTGGSGGAAGASSAAAPHGAEGYVTEKLYMLLQLYLQNKGWSPSIELLQCFSDLKESSMLPSAAYLQMMASRVGLDTQGRLILRENGKIILPYEHFANAVMLKHMNGPHGLHLGLEATVRAVVESYTIGREQFGMEKEFIIEVVQNCPNPACRYYKNQLEMTQKSIQQHLSQQPTYIPEMVSFMGAKDNDNNELDSESDASSQDSQTADADNSDSPPPAAQMQDQSRSDNCERPRNARKTNESQGAADATNPQDDTSFLRYFDNGSERFRYDGDEYHYFAINIASQLRKLPVVEALSLQVAIQRELIAARCRNMFPYLLTNTPSIPDVDINRSSNVQSDVYVNRNYSNVPSDVFINRNYSNVPSDVFINRNYSNIQSDVHFNRNYSNIPSDVFINRNYSNIQSDVHFNRNYSNIPSDVFINNVPRDFFINRNYSNLQSDVHFSRYYSNIQSDVLINRNSNVQSDVNVNRNSNVQSDIFINRNSNVQSDVLINRNSNVQSDVNVNRNSNVQSDVFINRNSNVQSDVLINRNSNVQSDVNVNRNSNVQSDVFINRNSNVQSDVNVNRNSNVQSDVLINRNSNVQRDVSVNRNSNVQRDVSVNRNSNVQSDVNMNRNYSNVQRDVNVNRNSNVQSDVNMNRNNSNVQSDVNMNRNYSNVQRDVNVNRNYSNVQRDVNVNRNSNVQSDVGMNRNYSNVQSEESDTLSAPIRTENTSARDASDTETDTGPDQNIQTADSPDSLPDSNTDTLIPNSAPNNPSVAVTDSRPVTYAYPVDYSLHVPFLPRAVVRGVALNAPIDYSLSFDDVSSFEEDEMRPSLNIPVDYTISFLRPNPKAPSAHNNIKVPSTIPRPRLPSAPYMRVKPPFLRRSLVRQPRTVSAPTMNPMNDDWYPTSSAQFAPPRTFVNTQLAHAHNVPLTRPYFA